MGKIIPKVIGVVGGIGSGKSVVCRVLECMGYPVYDCDSRAKSIMDQNEGMKRRIAEEICADAVDERGQLRRDRIAAVVFADKNRLERLNRLVHSAVRDDIRRWTAACGNRRLLFIETAILYQSGLDRMVDEVWEVTAPESVRVARVCARNGITPQQVRDRIASQAFTPDAPHCNIHYIDNSGDRSVLIRIDKLLNRR